MGCELSKLATVKSQNQTATDLRLPLTAKQKFTVMASWKAVSRALEPTGVYMLIRYVTWTTFSMRLHFVKTYVNNRVPFCIILTSNIPPSR
ncbi:hypothetical protein WH47_08619 [Habropoda laboriosa]|uniref:Neuroglobin n=1 Tax=Habropoda laboriosa TaxID=597456 RepID=A0A0L7QP50_9HYME|nr:hypothetical protein WH47_08619 [Habropoda laboriosa]